MTYDSWKGRSDLDDAPPCEEPEDDETADLVTDKGRAIAERVTRMVRLGLPINDALAIAAELGRAHGRVEGIEAAARCMRQEGPQS